MIPSAATRSTARIEHHSAFPAERLAAERETTVSICLPARDEEATIGPILAALMPLVGLGAVDQVVVVDDSTDGTAAVARAMGAEVYDQSSLRPEHGRVQGKGDAMWRALTVLTGEVVCFLDADSGQFGEHFACGLVGAVVCGDARFAKGFYRRPFAADGHVRPEGGGRVTELCARPLLRLLFPELAEIRQPLAGEVAVRRELLDRLAFPYGYGVDVALLIDAWSIVGLDGLAQVDLEARQNRHQPLDALGPMADAVVAAIARRAIGQGVVDPAALAAVAAAPERPPLAVAPAGFEHA